MQTKYKVFLKSDKDKSITYSYGVSFWATVTKIPWTGWLIQQIFVSHIPGAQDRDTGRVSVR